MSFSTVGACSKCGAPIYAPSVWMGITPPPSSHSCSCFGQVTITARLGGSTSIPEPSRTLHKWPTFDEFYKFAKISLTKQQCEAIYDWFESFVEKGEK